MIVLMIQSNEVICFKYVLQGSKYFLKCTCIIWVGTKMSRAIQIRLVAGAGPPLGLTPQVECSYSLTWTHGQLWPLNLEAAVFKILSWRMPSVQQRRGEFCNRLHSCWSPTFDVDDSEDVLA